MPAMQADCQIIIATPFGRLGANMADATVSEIRFLHPDTPTSVPDHALASLFAAEIGSYLDNPIHRPQLPCTIRGTAFQQRVWQAISNIAPGDVCRYGDMAASLNSAARAVGQACGANPFPIVVPCHRVVAANGLGGFANARDGWLMDAKRWLLRHEGAL